LVKGEDEIRQDAVMEQVFRYVNELMARQGNEMKVDSSSTNKARTFSKGLLKVFTYEIIPLSPASGVSARLVSFVYTASLDPNELHFFEHRSYNGSKTRFHSETTLSIKVQGNLIRWSELIRSTFRKYGLLTFNDFQVIESLMKSFSHYSSCENRFSSEWSDQTCRDYYKNAPKAGSRQAFDLICDHYSPVFRFFFLERFGYSTEAWHAAKMRYTRSVAVNSIVGHVLGIGDRHVSNILVHKVTGEVVHIDFGIVFEQGKVSRLKWKS